LGLASTPTWLDTDGLHGYLIGRAVASAGDRQLAVARYRELVDGSQADDAQFWQETLRGQIYLGDEDFARRMQARAEPQRLATHGIPRSQRRKPLSRNWEEILAACDGDRNRALYTAYTTAGMTMTELARHSGLSLSHVSRLIARAENEGRRET
jgi:putative transposase